MKMKQECPEVVSLYDKTQIVVWEKNRHIGFPLSKSSKERSRAEDVLKISLCVRWFSLAFQRNYTVLHRKWKKFRNLFFKDVPLLK